MGNNCCGLESANAGYTNSFRVGAGLTPSPTTREKLLGDGSGVKSLKHFAKKFRVESLYLHSCSGQVQSYLCTGENKKNSHYPNQKLLKSLELRKSCLKSAQERINRILKLDAARVEPLLDTFYEGGRLYLVSKNVEDRDLYKLANYRNSFSDTQIGSIAT